MFAAMLNEDCLYCQKYMHLLADTSEKPQASVIYSCQNTGASINLCHFYSICSHSMRFVLKNQEGWCGFGLLLLSAPAVSCSQYLYSLRPVPS
jgi:hypothetical protein